MTAAAAPLEGDVRRALDALHASGRLAHAALALPREDFEAHALAATGRRRQRLAGKRPPPLDELLHAAAAPDLYLAAAATRSVPGAWERLDATLRPRLEALGPSRGASPH